MPQPSGTRWSCPRRARGARERRKQRPQHTHQRGRHRTTRSRDAQAAASQDKFTLEPVLVDRRRTQAEGVNEGRMVRAVAVPRGWVVCAAKQGQQQHRELQRTLQRTWSPTERYSASTVVPVTRRHSEGVRCSGIRSRAIFGSRPSHRHRTLRARAAVAREARESSTAAIEGTSREIGVQRGMLAMRATRNYDHMVVPVPNGVQLHGRRAA